MQWGTQTQVNTEMLLFQKAYLSGESYRYYHLLSGQDLPIKPIEEIYHFFDNKHVQFLEFGADNHDKYRFRMGSFHYNGSNKVLMRLFSYGNRINTMFGRDRLTKYNLQVYKGSNWASLTSEAVKYLVEHRKLIQESLDTRFAQTRYISTHC